MINIKTMPWYASLINDGKFDNFMKSRESNAQSFETRHAQYMPLHGLRTFNIIRNYLGKPGPMFSF